MNIQLDVLGAAMMDRFDGVVDEGEGGAVDHGGFVDWIAKLMEKMPMPHTLSNGVGHTTILRLSTGP